MHGHIRWVLTDDSARIWLLYSAAPLYIYIYIYIYIHSKTSLGRATMGPTLTGPFMDQNNNQNTVIGHIWDRSKAVDIGEWSICGGGWLGRFSCILNVFYSKTNNTHLIVTSHCINY